MDKFLQAFTLVLYFGINNLFLYKYGIRQSFINIYVLIFLNNTLLVLLIYAIINIRIKDKFLRYLYFITVLTFFVFTLIINYNVEGLNLNVDRWSAMSVSINALLEGLYPYTQLDHLNQGSSNLPSLLVIGLPFYLLGNIGLIQSFSFLFFAYFMHKTVSNYKAKLIGLLLLIFSISYLWELYVKSDLMSNFILILGFILLSNGQKFKKPILLGIASSLLLFTRIVSIIPLVIFLFKDFIKTSLQKRLFFISSGLVATLLLFLLVLKDCPNIETLKNYNPFILQNKSSGLPLFISVFTMVLPFYFSFKVEKMYDVIKYSILTLSIPITLSFGNILVTEGFNKIIYNFLFDISYFNILMPFIIYFIVINCEKSPQLRKV